MNRLLDNRSFYINPLELVPKEINEKLTPYLDDIEKVMLWQEDVPHQKSHELEGLRGIRRITEMHSKIGIIEADLAERAFRNHDRGYKFVEMNLLKSEEHHVGSVLIASKIDPDIGVLRAIYYHVYDILPADTPVWARVVRDIDRVLLMGYIGVIRTAIYLGFKHPLIIERSQFDLVRDGILCDFNEPNSNLYEIKSQIFCYEYVFPFLYKNKLVQKIIDEAKTWISRFEGITTGGIPGTIIQESVRNSRYDEWSIDPVLSEIRSIYREKLTNTYQVVSQLENGSPDIWNKNAEWCRDHYYKSLNRIY